MISAMYIKLVSINNIIFHCLSCFFQCYDINFSSNLETTTRLFVILGKKLNCLVN